MEAEDSHILKTGSNVSQIACVHSLDCVLCRERSPNFGKLLTPCCQLTTTPCAASTPLFKWWRRRARQATGACFPWNTGLVRANRSQILSAYSHATQPLTFGAAIPSCGQPWHVGVWEFNSYNPSPFDSGQEHLFHGDPEIPE